MSGQSNTTSTGSSIRDRMKMFEQNTNKEEVKAKVGGLISSAMHSRSTGTLKLDSTQKLAVKTGGAKAETREENKESEPGRREQPEENKIIVGKSIADRMKMFQGTKEENKTAPKAVQSVVNEKPQVIQSLFDTKKPVTASTPNLTINKPEGKMSIESIIQSYAHAHDKKPNELPVTLTVLQKISQTQSLPKPAEVPEQKPTSKEVPQSMPGKLKSPFLEKEVPLSLPLPKPAEVPEQKETPKEVPQSMPGKLKSPFLEKEVPLNLPLPKPVQIKPEVPEQKPTPKEVPQSMPGKLRSPFLENDKTPTATNEPTTKPVAKLNQVNLFDKTPKAQEPALVRSKTEASSTDLPTSMPSIKDRISMFKKPVTSEEPKLLAPKPAPSKLIINPNIKLISFGEPPAKPDIAPHEDQDSQPTADSDSIKPAQPQSKSLFEDEEKPAQPKSKSLFEDEEKPAQTGFIKQAQPEFIKPAQTVFIKQVQPESIKQAQPEYIKPAQPELIKPAQSEFIKPAQPQSKSLFADEEKPAKNLITPKSNLFEEDEEIEDPLFKKPLPLPKPPVPSGYMLPRPVLLPPPPKVSLQEQTVKPAIDQKSVPKSILFDDKEEESAITLIKLGGSRNSKAKPEAKRESKLFSLDSDEDEIPAPKSAVSIESILGNKPKTPASKQNSSDMLGAELFKPTIKRKPSTRSTLFDED